MKKIILFLILCVILISCRSQSLSSTSQESTSMVVNGTYYLNGHNSNGIAGENVTNKLKFTNDNIVEYNHHDMIEVLIYELDGPARKVNIYNRSGNDRGNLLFQLDYINETTLHQNVNNATRVWKK